MIETAKENLFVQQQDEEDIRHIPASGNLPDPEDDGLYLKITDEPSAAANKEPESFHLTNASQKKATVASVHGSPIYENTTGKI